jgi:hypothetical protein
MTSKHSKVGTHSKEGTPIVKSNTLFKEGDITMDSQQ